MNRRTVFLLATCFTCCTAHAATPEQALESRYRAASAFLDGQLTRESIPGAALGIVHDQELVWSYQFGVESFDTGTPVSNDTLFSICSISKLFNGVAAMSLNDQGKLPLDTPLSTYIDGVEPQDNTGAEEGITTRNILSHVSGMPREPFVDYWETHSFPDTEQLRIDIAAQQQLYQPYDYYQYSNLGMAMLGDVIETISGQPWGEYVDENILTPLGMERTATDMPFDQVGNGFARGYYVRSPKGERKPVEAHSFKAFAPAAGVASSVNDLARFMSWHFRLLENGGEEILKATTLKNMLRLHWMGAEFDESAWGLGYVAYDFGDEVLWGHGGYCPGTRAELVMRLPTKLGVAMMVTANDISPWALAENVYGLLAESIIAANEATSDEDADSETEEKPDLAEYEGYYYIENYDDDSYIGLSEDGLFSIRIYSDDPAGELQTWVHEEGDVFRRQRDDGTLAEPIYFQRDEDGRVYSRTQHSYRLVRREIAE